MKTVDLVIKTYPTDYDWLEFLFRSIVRNVTGVRNIVVLLEEQYSEPPNLPPNAVVARCQNYYGKTPGRDPKIESGLGAVVERLGSFRYTDAEVISFVDSDCVFARPVDYQTDQTIIVEKPLLLWRTWDEAGLGRCWKVQATHTLRYDPPRETMCGYPFTWPRQVLEDFYKFVGGAERLLSLWDGITDWNALGNYAMDYHADKMTFMHVSKFWASQMQGCVRQFWSWYRPTHPEVQAVLRELGLL